MKHKTLTKIHNYQAQLSESTHSAGHVKHTVTTPRSPHNKQPTKIKNNSRRHVSKMETNHLVKKVELSSDKYKIDQDKFSNCSSQE